MSDLSPEKFVVRTTMRPDEPIEVTEEERTDLERQGLLASDTDREKTKEEE